MKKLLFLGTISALLSVNVWGYEPGMLSLDTPNVLKQHEGTFSIRHRFYGEADDFEKFLGTDDGGNIQVILKYAVLDNLLISAEHTRQETEYAMGIEYAKTFDGFGVGLRASGISQIKPGFEDRQRSYFLNASVQTPNFFDHLRFTANLGYNSCYEHQTLGLGFDLNTKNFIPYLSFTESISLIGEYYPQIDKIEGISGKNDSYAIGIKFQTFAHHFEILVSNSQQMDPRTMALGTNSDNVHFGFNINRKF